MSPVVALHTDIIVIPVADNHGSGSGGDREVQPLPGCLLTTYRQVRCSQEDQNKLEDKNLQTESHDQHEGLVSSSL